MSRSVDTWDDEPSRKTTSVTSTTGSAGGSRSKIVSPASVRDDWEMDEDEEDDGDHSVDERNKQIWEDANSKVHYPMPSLVVSRGSSSGSAVPSLPLNQPPAMRILKRPSPSISPSQSSGNINATGETFQEREARYQAARERIFGASTEEVADNGDKQKTPSGNVKKTSPPPPSTKVSREPHGPTNSNGNGGINQEHKGFGDRRTKRPPAPTTTPLPTTPPSNIPV
ncbi:hypothetical protein GALMADRAFT_278943 [Galerina marginata CBS 339.88]|uniref:SUZ domain-containing protein n=1 Tax=Galerina marginata (strain CBS 339.88) TaxID=685588 RepID=A0A067T1N1_GALM3|nr:hypothetical protein GALMADRAFT_278943 [Galerina marginata CBS 339.88]